MPHESYVARQDRFVVRQKLSTYLVFQLVARHHLDACNISKLACDKVRLILVWRQNQILFHILNIARTGTFQYIHSAGILQIFLDLDYLSVDLNFDTSTVQIL